MGVLGATASAGVQSPSLAGNAGTTAVAVAGADGPRGELAQLRAKSESVSPASPARFRLKEEADRVALRLDEELAYLETVFANATPGSPAQFRAHEEAESLREQLGTVGRG